MPGELQPALDGGATVRESGAAPAPGDTPPPPTRGRFRWDEFQDAIVEVPPTETELAERARRIELERRELLDAQWRRRR